MKWTDNKGTFYHATQLRKICESSSGRSVWTTVWKYK